MNLKDVLDREIHNNPDQDLMIYLGSGAAAAGKVEKLEGNLYCATSEGMKADPRTGQPITDEGGNPQIVKQHTYFSGDGLLAIQKTVESESSPIARPATAGKVWTPGAPS